MAFVHSKNVKVYSNGYDLTGYFNSIETPLTADTAETSVFGDTARTYLAGQKDSTLSAEGFFDQSANAVDVVLNTALSTDTEWTWYPNSDTVGSYGYGMKTVNTEYSIGTTIDDAATIAAAGQSKTGSDRGVSLHALSQETSSGNGTTVDNGSSTSNGGSAYVQATDVTGTVSLKITHSSDNFVGDDTDLVSFTDIDSDFTSERVTFTGTVKQYVRAVWTIGGGEDLTFNVLISRA